MFQYSVFCSFIFNNLVGYTFIFDMFFSSAFAFQSSVLSFPTGIFGQSKSGLRRALKADNRKLRTSLPWLRSWFSQEPILCFHTNRWLRFSKSSQLSVLSPQCCSLVSRPLATTRHCFNAFLRRDGVYRQSQTASVRPDAQTKATFG